MRNKNTHKQKLRMARRMMSKYELKNYNQPFASVAWSQRLEARAGKVQNREASAAHREKKHHARKEAIII